MAPDKNSRDAGPRIRDWTLDSPTQEQAEAFIEELLAQPYEATDWIEAFTAALESGHADTFRIFHHLAIALSPSRNSDFAYVCWAAVEHVGRLKTLERLREIARTLLESLAQEPTST